MAGEERTIRRDIAETRREIDEHLQEMGGQVRAGFGVPRQAAQRVRQNLPQILAGAAIFGLFTGMLVRRGGGRREYRMLRAEEARLARERRRLEDERERLARERSRRREPTGREIGRGPSLLGEISGITGEEYDIP